MPSQFDVQIARYAIELLKNQVDPESEMFNPDIDAHLHGLFKDDLSGTLKTELTACMERFCQYEDERLDLGDSPLRESNVVAGPFDGSFCCNLATAREMGMTLPPVEIRPEIVGEQVHGYVWIPDKGVWCHLSLWLQEKVG